MCYTCWEEAGKPSILNDKTIKAAELINEIYYTEDGGAGGNAHLVVDDWNLDDSSIDYCIKDRQNDIAEETIEACDKCLQFLKTLSMEERHSAMAISCDFLPAS